MIIKYKIIIFSILVFSGLIAAGEWQPVASLYKERAGAAAVVWENKIYIFGGKSSNNKILNSVECYDPARGEWDDETIPEFAEARYNAAAVVYQGKIYLIGGRGEVDVLKSVEVYDPAQNLWSDANDLHEKREGFSAVVLDGHIYVIGGQRDEHSLVNEIEWYDEEKDKWKEIKDHMSHPRAAPFAAAVGDTFYMFGGYYFGLTKTFYKGALSMSHFEWSSGKDLSEPRAYGASVLKGDSLFLIGGETQSGKTNLVEIYNIKTHQYYTATPLLSARSGVTGVCLNDSVYVIGGYDQESGEPVKTVDVYIGSPTTAITEFSLNLPPEEHILVKGYPNPFNGQITLQVSVGQKESYEVAIYDAQGKHVSTVYNGKISQSFRFVWQARDDNGMDVSSGIYFLIVKSPKQVLSYKMVYVK